MLLTYWGGIEEAHGGIENALQKIHVEIQRSPQAMGDLGNDRGDCKDQTEEVYERQYVQEKNLWLLRKVLSDQIISI